MASNLLPGYWIVWHFAVHVSQCNHTSEIRSPCLSSYVVSVVHIFYKESCVIILTVGVIKTSKTVMPTHQHKINETCQQICKLYIYIYILIELRIDAEYWIKVINIDFYSIIFQQSNCLFRMLLFDIQWDEDIMKDSDLVLIWPLTCLLISCVMNLVWLMQVMLNG